MVLKTRKVKMTEYTYIGERCVSVKEIEKVQCYLSESAGKKILKALWKSRWYFFSLSVAGYGVHCGTQQEMPMICYFLFGLGFAGSFVMIFMIFFNEFQN